MYKIMSAILALFLVLPLSACGSTDQNADQNGAAARAGISFTGEIGGEISIVAYEAIKYKAFLEEAARLFEEKYPGVRVKVEVFSAMPEIKTDGQGMIMALMQDDSEDRIDYINRTNTALMSGGGADILAMDVLPFYKYADGGQLENLADYMQSDPNFDQADYRANILEAAKYQNGIWFLPMDYSFNYYAYDSRLLPNTSGFGTSRAFTAGELMELAENSFDGSAKLFNLSDYTSRSGGIWSVLLTENYASFVDIANKTANFDDGSFAALLESVKRYSEQGYISKGVTARADAEALLQKAGEATSERIFFKSKNAVSLISLFTRNLGMKMTAMAEGDSMVSGDDDEIAGIAAGADGSVSFTYDQAYAINSNSKNKETAWAFLRFLLSEEMQLNLNLSPMTLPLANSAREQKMEIMLSSLLEEYGQSLNEAQLEALRQYNEAVEKLSGQINAYLIRDTIVDEMIRAEVQHFFAGAKSSAEVAELLQNRVALYLGE